MEPVPFVMSGQTLWIRSSHLMTRSERIVSTKPISDLLPPTFTTETARSRGVHPRDLYAWRDGGDLVELTRGVYRRADALPASYPDALAVSYRSPRVIVCCVSAAAVHDLTDEMPAAVQIAVPKRAHSPVIDHPLVQVFRFEESLFEVGLSSFEAAPGERVRIYDPARTVVDLMRFRRRFGEPVAHSSLRRYLDSAASPRPALLLEYASVLGVFGPMRVVLDVMSAG